MSTRAGATSSPPARPITGCRWRKEYQVVVLPFSVALQHVLRGEVLEGQRVAARCVAASHMRQADRAARRATA
jgi:hypothetical protein